MPIINCSHMSGLIQRALNFVDSRLVDHGRRVSYLVAKMLEYQGKTTSTQRQKICMLALIHDIGAYKTEEIDRLWEFETKNIWSHSIYGYLFIKYLSPLGELAEIILLHHLDANRFEEGINPMIANLAKVFHLADRIDVLMEHGGNRRALMESLQSSKGTRFDAGVADLFFEADKSYHILETYGQGAEKFLPEGESFLSGEEVDAYLKMIIYAIDFRSRHTVTHSMTTTVISHQLAQLMHMKGEEISDIYYGALLHDIGKIGIPISILEFDGKLSLKDYQIMKTHIDMGEQILGDSVDRKISKIALRHHEKLDGSGYPKGLSSGKLSLSERIVGVADIVSALSGMRSYKEAFSKEKTIHIIKDMAQQGLIDSEVVSVAIENFGTIMETVAQESGPIAERYDRIQEEYWELMKKYQGIK